MHQFDPDWVVAPGEILAELLEGRSSSVRAEVMKILNISPDEFEALLAGRLALNQPVAEALEAASRIPSSLWLQLEQAYRDGLRAGKQAL